MLQILFSDVIAGFALPAAQKKFANAKYDDVFDLKQNSFWLGGPQFTGKQ